MNFCEYKFLLEQSKFFIIVAVKRSDTFRSQTLPTHEKSMSMAEQNEMVNKYFCGRTIRASKVLFCIAMPLLQKGLLEKGGENRFYSFISPLGNPQTFHFIFSFSPVF
jgi:hypothetical protein